MTENVAKDLGNYYLEIVQFLYTIYCTVSCSSQMIYDSYYRTKIFPTHQHDQYTL